MSVTIDAAYVKLWGADAVMRLVLYCLRQGDDVTILPEEFVRRS